HGVTSDRVERIEIATFHEAVRLATNRPRTTEEAQYSTSFPCAVALVKGAVTPDDIAGDALDDPEVLRLSTGLVMVEDDHANTHFPSDRLARTTLVLRDGQRLVGDYTRPLWDHRAPPTEAELRAKYHALADPVLGRNRADAIEEALNALPRTGLAPLSDQLLAPIN
ncbi:MAG: MmgE/PrpD family protein, partial [Pseudomonadota bacterium]